MWPHMRIGYQTKHHIYIFMQVTTMCSLIKVERSFHFLLPARTPGLPHNTRMQAQAGEEV
jgi:hypothetical protein